MSVSVDATNKACSVEMLHAAQPWIVDANRVWGSNVVRRFNRGFVRWPAGWTNPTIQFEAIVNSNQTGGLFAVVVDGVVQQVVTVAADAAIHTVTVTGLSLAPGGSTVDVWEAWNGRLGSGSSLLNTGADAPIAAGYLTAVWLPLGLAPVKPTCTTGIVTVTDSIFGCAFTGGTSDPLTLAAYGSAAAQIQLLAQAKGWLLTNLCSGGATLLGDGLTNANYVTLIQQAVAAMGSPANVTVYFQIGYNDYGQYGAQGISSTPTQIATALSAIAGLLSPYRVVICTPTPSGTETANGGGFTLGNYRTPMLAVTGSNVTTLDGTSFGINPASDENGGGPHMNSSGAGKLAAGVRGALGV